MLEDVAGAGKQGSSPSSSRRDAYDCQSFICETRDLPANISPHIRRKSSFDSAWGREKVFGQPVGCGMCILSALVSLLTLEHAA